MEMEMEMAEIQAVGMRLVRTLPRPRLARILEIQTTTLAEMRGEIQTAMLTRAVVRMGTRRFKTIAIWNPFWEH